MIRALLCFPLALLVLSACATPSRLGDATTAPIMVLPGLPASRPHPEPGEVEQPTPQPEPAPQPGQPAGSEAAASSEAGSQATGSATLPVPAPPSIRWYPRGIGLPLISDDPAAKGKKVAMLTFDDGPNPNGSTEQILDILKANDVRAIFFITGNGLKNPTLVERIHREGHLLGPHTVTHANLTKLSVAEMRTEIDPLVELIKQVTGEQPKYFRPPYGMYNKELLGLLEEYGMQLVNWTDGSMDWEYNEPDKIVDEVMKQLYNGAVVLMHDTKQQTVEALPEVIRKVREAGYEFVVLQ